MALTKFKFNKESLLGISGIYYFNLLTDIYLLLESDQSGVYEDFKFQVSIHKGTQLIRTYELVPNYGTQLITNITPVLKDYFNQMPTVIYGEYLSTKSYEHFRIYVAEYYDGDQQSLEYKNIYVLDARPRTLEDEKKYLYPHDDENNIREYVLTKASTSYIDINKAIMFPLLRRNRYVTIHVKLYITPTTGIEYQFNLNTVDTEQKLVNFNLKNFIDNNYQPSHIAAAVKIEIYLTVDLIMDRKLIKTYIVDKCNSLIALCWQNEFGGWETYHFYDYYNETDTEQSKILRKQHLYDGNYVFGGTTIVNARQVERMTLWTHWINDEEAEYLYKSLLQAKRVYMVDIVKVNDDDEYQYTPVTIVGKSVKHDRNKYNDLVNVSVTVEKNIYDNL